MNKINKLNNVNLYLCINYRDNFYNIVEQSLLGGVNIIQFRDYITCDKEAINIIYKAQKVITKYNALLSINNRPDIARIVKADILHLGQDDIDIMHARYIVGDKMIIGLSTHNKEQIDKAISCKEVDYFSVGPIWKTPTKPNREACGIDIVEYAIKKSNKPFFAIGSIDIKNIDQLIKLGVTKVAVVRAILDSDNPYIASMELSQKLI